MKFRASAFTFLPAGLLLADLLVVVMRLAAARSDPAGIGRTVLAALVYSQLSLLVIWAVLSRRRWWMRVLALVALYAVAIVVLATPEIVLFARAGSGAEFNALVETSAEFSVFLLDAWFLSLLGLAVVLLIMRRRGLSPVLATPGDCPETAKPWQFSTVHLLLGVTYVALFIALVQFLHRARLHTMLSAVVYASVCLFYVFVACTALWATLAPGRTRPRLLLFSAVPVLGGAFTAWMTALHVMPAVAPITPYLLVPSAIFGVLYPCQIAVVLLVVRGLGYRLARHAAPGAAQAAQPQSRTELAGDAVFSRRRRLLSSLAGLAAVAAMGVAALALGSLWLGDSASNDAVSQPAQQSDERLLASALDNQAIDLAQQGKLSEAIRDYDKAIDIYTRLVEQEGHSELVGQLAWALSNRGSAYDTLGQLPEAVRDYDKAIDIHTSLVEKGRSVFARTLALGLTNRGDTRAKQGKLPEAVRDYDKAIDIYTRLVEKEAHPEFASYLAWTLSNRGVALGQQAKLPEAIRDYDKAVDIYTRLVEQEGRPEFASNLALVLHNRGIDLGMQGKLPESIRDADKAIDIYTRLVEKEGHSELANYLASALNDRGAALAQSDKLPEAIQNLNKAIDIYTRLVEQQGRSELADQLGRALNNRGSTLAKQGKLPEAIRDYDKAIDIRTRLVEQEGRSDVTDDLAQSLNSLAWLHATVPDAQFRDGAKAVRDATLACELTGWNDFKMLDTLAAACAEQGDFKAATKWETTAIELAPEDQRAEPKHRLDLFQSRQPYRQP